VEIGRLKQINMNSIVVYTPTQQVVNLWPISCQLNQFVTVQHKYPRTMTSHHASTNNHGPTAINHFSEVGHFIRWTQAGHQKQFKQISYEPIGLSVADITVV
jgi:hypothetical protein